MMRFQTLRGRLLASHSLVLILALTLMLLFGSVAIRRYETRADQDRVRDLAVPITLQVNALLRADAVRTPRINEILDDALRYSAEQMDVRILVISPGNKITFDSAPDQSLLDLDLSPYSEQITSLLAGTSAHQRGGVTRVSINNPGQIAPVLAGKTVVLAAVNNGNARAVVGIAATPATLPVLRRLLPSLLLSAVVAMLITTLLALALSRRIAKPIVELTAASRAMATGHLRQELPRATNDELGQLVQSFNTMSAQVANLDERQRTFLAMTAHDLRTPLTTITGYCQALQDGLIETPEEQSRILGIITDEAARMSRLVRDLLEYARLQSQLVQLKISEIRIDLLVADLVARFQQQTIQKQLSIRSIGEPEMILGDRDLLTRLLENLLSNAIRFSPTGSTIEITTTSTVSALSLTVEDRGPGIATADKEVIFAPFRTTGSTGQTGIGLAVAREIVTLHGGTIAAENRSDGGARFRITLPANPASGSVL